MENLEYLVELNEKLESNEELIYGHFGAKQNEKNLLFSFLIKKKKFVKAVKVFDRIRKFHIEM
jgi:pentatricopeptide repeat protein